MGIASHVFTVGRSKMVLHLTQSQEQLKIDELLHPVHYKIMDVRKLSDYHFDVECEQDIKNENDNDYNIMTMGSAINLNYSKRIYWRNTWWKEILTTTNRLIHLLSDVKTSDIKELANTLKNG